MTISITTVKKLRGDNFLVNGNMVVPKNTENRHYRSILNWLTLGNKLIPLIATIDDVEIELKLRLESYFSYNFGIQTGVHEIKGDSLDKISETNQLINASAAMGKLLNNVLVETKLQVIEVSINEWNKFFLAILLHRQKLWNSAAKLKQQLKTMTLLELSKLDVTDDVHWS